MNEMARPLPGRMSLDEFLVWNAPGPHRWQLIDGEAVEMAPANPLHGRIQAESGRLIGNHLLEIGSRCHVIDAPGVVPRVRAEMNFRIPDLGVAGPSPSPESMVNDPIILVEILSPSNETETRANVWAYTTIPSLQEILLVRSSRIEAELLRRDADGNWSADAEKLGRNSTLTLDSIGFATPLAALYRTTGLQR